MSSMAYTGTLYENAGGSEFLIPTNGLSLPLTFIGVNIRAGFKQSSFTALFTLQSMK